MPKYIAFWIPTREKIDFKKPQKNQISVNLSDIPNARFEIIIKLIIDETTKEPTHFQIKDYEDSITLSELKIIYYDDTGIIICEIMPGFEDSLSLPFEKIIYHKIKEFYHNHEFHSGEEDTLLTAYKFENFNEISKNSINDLLLNIFNHYISIYEKKFILFEAKIKEEIDSIKEILKHQIETDKKRSYFKTLKSFLFLKDKKYFQDLFDSKMYIKNKFNIFFGEYEYFKFLAYEFDNFRHDIITTPIRIKKVKNNIKKITSIKNNIKKIDDIYENLSTKEQSFFSYLEDVLDFDALKKAVLGIHYTLIGILISIVISIISLIFSLIFNG